MRVSNLLTAVVAVVLLSLSAGEAIAEPTASPLTLCNKMSSRAEVSIGYFSSGVSDTEHMLSGPFVSEGWWHIDPGVCQTFPNPFSARYMFWYAFDYMVNNGVGLNDNETVVLYDRIKPGQHMCVTSYFRTDTTRTFTYEDENVSKDTCDRATNSLWIIPNKVDTLIQSQVDITAQ